MDLYEGDKWWCHVESKSARTLKLVLKINLCVWNSTAQRHVLHCLSTLYVPADQTLQDAVSLKEKCLSAWHNSQEIDELQYFSTTVEAFLPYETFFLIGRLQQFLWLWLIHCNRRRLQQWSWPPSQEQRHCDVQEVVFVCYSITSCGFWNTCTGAATLRVCVTQKTLHKLPSTKARQ